MRQYGIGSIGSIWTYLLNLALFIILMIFELAGYEAIHGLVWGLINKGLIREYLTPYCCCGSPLLRGQYILGSVMPTIILGFIQGWIAIRTGSFLLFCLSLSSSLQGDHLFTQKCDAGASGISDPVNLALITLLWMPIQQPSEISNNTLMSFFIVDTSFLSSNAITVSP